jgi:hypothetical protein
LVGPPSCILLFHLSLLDRSENERIDPMKHPKPILDRAGPRHRGFALIITLVLMILLVVMPSAS